MSSRELRIIAELEHVATNVSSEVEPRQSSRLRTAGAFLARLLPWLAPLGFGLVILPVALGWRLVGLLLALSAIASCVLSATPRARERRRREPS